MSVDEQVSEESTSETVDISGLDEASLYEHSDDELAQLLERATQELEGEVAEEDTPSDGAETPPEEAEASKDDSAGQKDQGDEKSQEDFVKVSKADWEKQQAELKQKEQFIQRRNSELGELRKQLADARAKKSQDLDEMYDENPREARKVEREIEELDKGIQQIDQERQTMARRLMAEKAVSEFLQPEEFDVNAMAETLASIGLPQQAVQSFRADPYSSGATPMEIVLAAKAAQGNKLVMQMARYAKQLQDKVSSLEHEAKEGPKRALSNIEQALKSKPGVSASSGGAGKGINSIDPASIAELSDEELAKALSQSG